MIDSMSAYLPLSLSCRKKLKNFEKRGKNGGGKSQLKLWPLDQSNLAVLLDKIIFGFDTDGILFKLLRNWTIYDFSRGAYQIFPKSWIFRIFTYSVCVFAYSHSRCRISFLQIQPRYINSVLTLYFRHCTMWPRLSFCLRLFFRGCWGRRGRPASRPRWGHDFPNTFKIFHSSIVFSVEAIFRPPKDGDGLKKKDLYAIEALYQLVVRHKKRYYCLLWVLCYGAALPNSAWTRLAFSAVWTAERSSCSSLGSFWSLYGGVSIGPLGVTEQGEFIFDLPKNQGRIEGEESFRMFTLKYKVQQRSEASGFFRIWRLFCISKHPLFGLSYTLFRKLIL